MAKQKGKNLKRHCARLGEMRSNLLSSETPGSYTQRGRTSFRDELPPSSLRVTNFTFDNSAQRNLTTPLEANENK